MRKKTPKSRDIIHKDGRIPGHVNSVPYGQECETIERMWVVTGV